MEKILFEFRKMLFKKRKDLNSIILYLSFAFFLILLILSHNFIFKPLKNKYMDQMDAIYTYNANISSLSELSLSGEIMNNKVNDIKEVYSQLNNIVPDERNVPFVTSQISLAAENNDIDISFMKKTAQTSVTLGTNVFGVVKYNLVCFSSYENIVNFLATLETTNSIFAIEKINLEPLSAEEQDKYDDVSLIKTTLNVNIYMKSK